jgi:hypothetical protein
VLIYGHDDFLCVLAFSSLAHSVAFRETENEVKTNSSQVDQSAIEAILGFQFLGI